MAQSAEEKVIPNFPCVENFRVTEEYLMRMPLPWPSRNSACWKSSRKISALEQVGISVQISRNICSHCEETCCRIHCSFLQLYLPPWQSRFSAPAKLSQARWTEELCGFVSHKNLYGIQVLDLTSLGHLRWVRAKRAFPACPCCLSCPGAGMCCPQNVSGPSLEILGFFFSLRQTVKPGNVATHSKRKFKIRQRKSS